MEINHVCSLGPFCHSSQILKQNGLKKCSYPFDWIFSSCDNIIHCLEDDFKIFLDQSFYNPISKTQCGHSYYHPQMFNHHNPLYNENDYQYFVRCVGRFKQLLVNPEHKLFTMIFVNKNNITENDFKKIIDFNYIFKKYACNYTLLVIFHIRNKQYNYHEFTCIDNIHFLEIHTLSHSTGLHFTHGGDNDYLNWIINNHYHFNIK